MKKDQLVRAFQPVMQKNGFIKKNHRYCTVKNDLYLGVSFDCPSGLVYCTAYIIPLWLPCDAENYTYGNRIHNMKQCDIPPFRLDRSDDAAVQWVSEITGFLESNIFPFFSSINSPGALLLFLQNTKQSLNDFFSCSEYEWNRLLVYMNFYAGTWDGLLELIQNTKETLSASTYLIDSVKNRYLQELLGIAKIVELNDFKKASKCRSETIMHTRNVLQI